MFLQKSSLAMTDSPSSPRQYGPFHIPEDASVGTTVAAVLARDADVRGGDSWQVDYRVESGNEEEVFTLRTDRQTNEVSLMLSKVNVRPPSISLITQTVLMPAERSEILCCTGPDRIDKTSHCYFNESTVKKLQNEYCIMSIRNS